MYKKRQILFRPILTEKMNQLEDSQNMYAFQVDPHSNKIEIKRAVEEKFDVKITKVRTMNFLGKSKQMSVRSGGRVIKTSGKRSSWKKAVVTLDKGFSIDLYDSGVES
ncbi:MAG TPA: 50S ribosomal protein L23 [Candidatus Marinimicrobia bacterium]|nr:50S ribosomal protein L23 [Candidatus Neomarinimicrobiota bacterium]HHZ98229.1 50S ribosomal protein L23 [Candidatus Neomarinimicrobiota bacterium]HIB02942.1 50S ribosomal protein L23 [Candidatus Neomarinimicrobiota bacterium]HIB71502.1 50S ribosomal protein L23 [Candidatus Neomarinimicrobiota bacterium]HIB95834.1 50S ribosomal protein L23 [Candidatus Neomarinimicrobiota bacterium]